MTFPSLKGWEPGYFMFIVVASAARAVILAAYDIACSILGTAIVNTALSCAALYLILLTCYSIYDPPPRSKSDIHTAAARCKGAWAGRRRGGGAERKLSKCAKHGGHETSVGSGLNG